MMFYTCAVIKALFKSPIIERYLVTCTFSAVTAHSSYVVGGVDGLLLPYSEVEELLSDLYAVLQTSWCSCSPNTAVSSLESLQD
jgi:hypothetical protein